MAGRLIMLPARVSLDVTRFVLRAVLRQLLGGTPDDNGRAPEPEARREREPAAPVRRKRPQVETPPPAPEPAHVSEEPVLVEELAEPGAEDGAGATIRVSEPWEGYAQLKAKDVIARLTDATEAELAAVELYEQMHRGRQTVSAAARRELRRRPTHLRKEQQANG